MAQNQFNLKESKLYTLCRSTALLDDLVPDIRVQMIAESDIEQTCPRDEKLGDATRILVNYTNSRGNSTLFQITDNDRLESPVNIDIDDFIQNYGSEMFDNQDIEDPIAQMKLSVVAALTFSVMTCIGMGDHSDTKSMKALAEWFVRACVAVVYDDPKDILFLLREKPMEDGTFVTVITNIWIIKTRNT